MLWGRQGGGGSSPVEPGSMLWLIQRDFLEGKTVQSMVSEALQPVPNPFQDQDIAQVSPAMLTYAAAAAADSNVFTSVRCQCVPACISCMQ